MAGRQLRYKKRKPLIVIGAEGEKNSSEYNYFRHFANRDLRIKFSTGGNTDPKGMLNNLLKYMDNEDIKSEDMCKAFLVFDTDLNAKRINEIKEIKQRCINNKIEIITSAPTFEIWYIMHYRNDKLKFQTSKDVKRELHKINGTYTESMDIYEKIKDSTDKARKIARSLELRIIKNNEDLLKANPHTSVYRILDAIDEFNNLNSIVNK